jgi:hypothetical protein
MKKITTLITIILFISSSLFAQLGEIKGFVKNKVTGELLFGANVYIDVAGAKVGDASNPDGKYTIKPVKSGVHTVHVTMLGYKNLRVTNVAVSSDRITYVNVDLENSAVEMGEFVFVEEIEVKHEVPLINPDEPHVKILTASDIKNDVNIHDPIKIVTGIPGVTLAANGKDVYVRGSRPSSTQFVTDGMKSITGDIGIPGQAIGSVKVYTGGVPSRYGDLTGGVIVVETKSYFDLAQKFK